MIICVSEIPMIVLKLCPFTETCARVCLPDSWPCLHAWLEQKPPGIQTCPVCKSAVDGKQVVPLYGRGNQSSSTPGGSQSRPTDPRTKTDDASTAPNRPRGQWQQAPANPDEYYMPFFGTVSLLEICSGRLVLRKVTAMYGSIIFAASWWSTCFVWIRNFWFPFWFPFCIYGR